MNCRRNSCEEEAIDKHIMLLTPDGKDEDTGPLHYCDEHFDEALGAYAPRYYNGRPCYVVRRNNGT